MLQGEYRQERLHAIRSFDKSIPPDAVHHATSNEIYHIDTYPDPETMKENRALGR